MKLHRIAVLPFAMIADVASLGNIGGDRSFTGQVFDADERDREREFWLSIARLVVEAKRAAAHAGSSGGQE